MQVGKSAFVRAMLKEMGQFDSANFDPAAMSNGRYLPVESDMPGTTLGIIPLQAFATGGTLYGECGHKLWRIRAMQIALMAADALISDHSPPTFINPPPCTALPITP